MDALIRHWAENADKIYKNQTAGDHTWTGFIVSFIMEYEKAKNRGEKTAFAQENEPEVVQKSPKVFYLPNSESQRKIAEEIIQWLNEQIKAMETSRIDAVGSSNRVYAESLANKIDATATIRGYIGKMYIG